LKEFPAFLTPKEFLNLIKLSSPIQQGMVVFKNTGIVSLLRLSQVLPRDTGKPPAKANIATCSTVPAAKKQQTRKESRSIENKAWWCERQCTKF